MKLRLLEVLCCPACRGDLVLASRQVEDDEVITGTLSCGGCRRAFQVEDGIPLLIARPEEVAGVKRGFEYQWLLRLRGRYEPPETCYGFLTHGFAAWLLQTYAWHLGTEERRWLLDAGCGSAEKTAEMAGLRPGDEVVGLDLTGSLAISRRKNASRKNLHLVQGDVRYPPFKRGVFDFIFSIGVLHHAPGTTRQGFDALAELLSADGALMTWLYPLPEEDPFWAALYRQRDHHFRGQGSKLPRPLLLALCHAYAALALPGMLRASRERARQTQGVFPFVPRLGPWAFYKASVFTSFDNLMPEHQRRHGRAEVEGWYRELGLGQVDSRFPGFFCGRRPT